MIKQYIKSYKDFPKQGIDFKCTASLCAGEGFKLTNNFMYDNLLKYMPCDKIVGLDARGFILVAYLHIAHAVHLYCAASRANYLVLP